jgi:hypothetical protein
MELTNDTQAEIARVAVRLPPFWADQPDMWFAQAEAQFSLTGITTKQKVLPRDLTVGPSVLSGSAGHNYLPTTAGPQCGVVCIGMREDTHVNILPSPKGLVLEMERELSDWTS